jgi:hypothetical protein
MTNDLLAPSPPARPPIQIDEIARALAAAIRVVAAVSSVLGHYPAVGLIDRIGLLRYVVRTAIAGP